MSSPVVITVLQRYTLTPDPALTLHFLSYTLSLLSSYTHSRNSAVAVTWTVTTSSSPPPSVDACLRVTKPLSRGPSLRPLYLSLTIFLTSSFLSFPNPFSQSVRIELRDLEPDDWAIVAFCYPSSATFGGIGYSGRAKNTSVPQAASWSAMVLLLCSFSMVLCVSHAT